MDDLKPESLWKFRVMEFGPLLVAMDSHGGRLYTAVKKTGQARRRAGEPGHEVIRRVMAAICHRRRFQSTLHSEMAAMERNYALRACALTLSRLESPRSR